MNSKDIWILGIRLSDRTGEADKVRALRETVDRLSDLVDQHSDQTRSLEQALSETVKAVAEADRKANLRLDDAESNILGILEDLYIARFKVRIFHPWDGFPVFL